jgi:LPS-assembly lipoprotein
MSRRWFLFIVLALSACGFQLRGVYSLPFKTLYISLPETNELRAVIKRNIEASTQTHVVDDARDAQARLTILGDAQQKNILSLNSAGKVREFQLLRTFTFRVDNAKGQDFIPVSTIRITRDITFNDTAVLAKDTEESLLWRDMQNDLVQQLLRRLAAAKLRPAEG